MKDDLEYFQINEATGRVEGLTVLERVDDIICEYRDEKLLRSFKMIENLPIEINWGSAVSVLKRSFKEAIGGSPFEEYSDEQNSMHFNGR